MLWMETDSSADNILDSIQFIIVIITVIEVLFSLTDVLPSFIELWTTNINSEI
jgi:hypothetical protein